MQNGYDAYIGYFATFTYGEWWNAQQETISPFLNPLLEQNPYTEWVPEYDGGQPPVTETLHEHLQRVAKEAQTVSHGS